MLYGKKIATTNSVKNKEMILLKSIAKSLDQHQIRCFSTFAILLTIVLFRTLIPFKSFRTTPRAITSEHPPYLFAKLSRDIAQEFDLYF